jgi:hypothetical protein
MPPRTPEQEKEYQELLAKSKARLDALKAQKEAMIAQSISEEASPDVSFKERFIAKNLGSSPESMAAYLRKQHPDMGVVVHKGNVYLKKPGQEKYLAMDPAGFDLQDITDIAYDIPASTAQGAATTAAAAAALPAGPLASFAAGSAASGASTGATELLKQYLGEKFGIPQNINTDALKEAAAVGALSPAIGSAIGAGVSQVGKGAKALGGKIYKSAFEAADRALDTEEGKGSIADLLKAERFKGGMKAAKEKVSELHKMLGEKIGAARSEATKAGSTADIATVWNKADDEQFNNIILGLKESNEPELNKRANDLIVLRDRYLQQGEKSPEALAAIKNVNKNEAGGSALYKQLQGPKKSQEDQLRMLLGKKLNEAENIAVGQHLGDNLLPEYLTNKKNYGLTSAFTEKQLAKSAAREANRTGILPSAVDITGQVGAVASGNTPLMTAMAAKKVRDVLRLTGTKTKLGLGLEDLGQYGQDVLSSQELTPQVWLEILRNNQEQK